MNTQSLLDRYFEVAFSAPEGVKRLRELILNLAIRGLLVSQDPNDPPASKLFKKIQAEKQRLISEGKISRQKPLPELQSNTMPMRVPQNWKWVKLEDLVDIITGISKGKSYKLQEMICLPYLRVANVQRGYVDLEIMKYLSIPLVDLPRYEVLQNDLLITEGGDWDKVGRTAIWKGEITPCIHQNHVFKARKFIKEQDVFWMQLYLNSPVARSYFAGASKQTTNLASINKTQLRGCPIPLPPAPEQHRIVAKVDRLMEQCDRLEQLHKEREQKRIIVHAAACDRLLNAKGDRELQTAWEFLRDRFGDLYAVKENISELRKVILQLAVMGKLVPQDPNDPPASELLKEIQAEREQLVQGRKTKTEYHATNIKPHEIPFDLPKGWKWARLIDLVDVGTGSTPNKGNSKYYGGTIPWYTSAATNNVVAEKPSTFITEKALEETNCKIFPAGSLIIALYGQGKTRGQISEIPLAGATNQAIAAMVFLESSKTVKRYIKYYFLKIYDEIRSLAEGGAQPNLNVGKVKATLIPLPPIPEQHRIVAKVDQLMQLCDQLESKIDQQTQTQTRLLNTLMAELN